MSMRTREEFHRKPKEIAETLLGVLAAEETELLKAARYLATHASGDLGATFADVLVPKLSDQINALRGNRPMASDCEESLEAEAREKVREKTGPGNEFASACLPECTTTRLADFYSDLGRVLINHQILHALALVLGDEILAGIAWNHVYDLNALLHDGAKHLAKATVDDFAPGDREQAAAAVEQMARIWPATNPAISK